MNNRWLRIGGVAAGWAALGLLLSVEVYFNMRAQVIWADFAEIAIPQFGRAAMWGCLAPFVLKLQARVPLKAGHWVAGILFHVTSSFVVMATFYLGRIWAYAFFFEASKGGFWQMAANNFYGHNMVDLAYYWAVIAFGSAAELQRRFKNEEIRTVLLETRLIEAELKSLREQLKPHFLFNTLNTISVMIRDGKSEMAVTLLSRLGSLLRMSLDGNHKNETTLHVEIDFLERYIEIQKARFSDRLTVNIAIEQAALGASVPWLLLQPIVENAILHGVAQKSGPGKVEIAGHVALGYLHLEVRDDGPGFPSNRGLVEGTGLSNTRERLAKTYGTASSMTLRGREEGGISVKIVLPCRA